MKFAVLQLFIAIDVQNPPGEIRFGCSYDLEKDNCTACDAADPLVTGAPGRPMAESCGAMKSPVGVGVGSMKPWLNHSTI